MPQDSYARARNGYFVRSLYFDSYSDKSLKENEEGLFFRQKFRLRIYDLDASEIKFEIKNKFGEHVFKETATISRNVALKIIDGDYADLLKYNNPTLNKIYATFTLGNYKPKLIVEYQRDAFLLDLFNIRITFDKNIRLSNSNFDLFSKNSHTLPILLSDQHLLEIKFNQTLPDHIRSILQIDSFEKTGFSKYSIGRKL